VSLEPDSNVNFTREEQLKKQDWPRLSTTAGMQMDFRAEQPINANLPILVSPEPSSNAMASNEVCFSKQQSPMHSHSLITATDLVGPKCVINVIPLNSMREPPETQ
jgi:hypothetical protein